MRGKTSATLFKIVRLLAHIEQFAINQCNRGGKPFRELDLLGYKIAFASRQFFKLTFFALEFLLLLPNAIDVFLGISELAVKVIFTAKATGRAHFHLGRADLDVVGMFA
jgi:hypothetical protein